MTPIKTSYLALPLLAALTACSDSNNDNDAKLIPTVLDAKYQGTWLAPAYGYGFTIDDDKQVVFQYSTNFCFKDEETTYTSDAELEEELYLEDDDLHFYAAYGTKDFHAPALVFTHSDQLPSACEAGIAEREAPSNSTDWTEDLAYFNEVMGAHSISPSAQNLDWDTIYANHSAAITSGSTKQDVLEAMVNMIEPLADGHTSIMDDGEEYSFNNKPTLLDAVFEYALDELALSDPLSDEDEQRLVELAIEVYLSVVNTPFSYAEAEDDIELAAGGEMAWFVNDNIAYLKIDQMYGYYNGEFTEAANELAAIDEVMDQVLADIADTDGLILDVRTNTGGADFVSLAIASRFTDSVVHAYSKQARLNDSRTPLVDVMLSPRGESQYTQPIVLLVSANTVSAGEIFSLGMSSLPHVTLMGEQTQGSLSDILEKQSGNGIEFGYSNEYYLSNTGTWFEASGIPVDIEIEAFQAEGFEEGRDLTLEAAADYLDD